MWSVEWVRDCDTLLLTSHMVWSYHWSHSRPESHPVTPRLTSHGNTVTLHRNIPIRRTCNSSSDWSEECIVTLSLVANCPWNIIWADNSFTCNSSKRLFQCQMSKQSNCKKKLSTVTSRVVILSKITTLWGYCCHECTCCYKLSPH